MFTRRGDTKSATPLSEPTLIDLQIREARNAAPPPIPLQSAAPAGISIVPMGPTYVNGEHPSVIGEDLTIEGQAITIRCRGALEINGKIQAELHSQRLTVGKSAAVEGTITADSIEVWGRVSGTIMGSRVMLHPSAEVEGDIHAKSLAVSDGATFEGRSRRVTDPATITPRLEPGAPAPVASSGEITVPLPRSV